MGQILLLQIQNALMASPVVQVFIFTIGFCPAFVNVFHEFEADRFYRKFPELKKFKKLCPERISTEKDLLGWMITIQQNSQEPTLEKLIRIFTLDAAKSIDLEKEVGSLKPGKRPGLMLISGMDYQNLRLTEKSHLKRLI